MIAPLLKLIKIDIRNNEIEYIDTLTRKGHINKAMDLYKSDLYEKFDDEGKKQIAFYAGVQHKGFGHRPLVIGQDKTSSTKILITLVTMYTVVFFSSNILGDTVFSLGDIFGYKVIAPLAVCLYALTFSIDSILAEVYGPKLTRWIYSIVCAVSAFSLFLLWVVAHIHTIGPNIIKAHVFNRNSSVYLVFTASIFTFLLSQFINATCIGRMKYSSFKNKNKSRKQIAFRFLTATFISTLADSLVFCLIVFSQKMGLYNSLGIALTQFTLKFLYDAILVMFITSLVVKIKKITKMDVVEKPKFSATGLLSYIFKWKSKNSVM